MFKAAAYTLLGDMTSAIGQHSCTSMSTSGEVDADLLRARVLQAMDVRQAELSRELAGTVAAVLPTLPPHSTAVLTGEFDRWQQATGWRLINDAAASTTT